MSLVDTALGIEFKAEVPSRDICADVIITMEQAEQPIVERDGFTFRSMGCVIDGMEKGEGKVLFSNSVGTVIKWDKEEDIYVYLTDGTGLDVVWATIKGNIYHLNSIHNSKITGNIIMDSLYLYIKGHVEVTGRIVVGKSKITFETQDGRLNDLIIYPKEVSGNELQPLIGPTTHDGMSFGRWSPVGEDKVLREIVVNDVIVQIKSDEPFTIGSYGYETVPTVTVKGNGDLLCPERTGTRLLLKCPVAPQGSTKISGRCKYYISYKPDYSDVPLTDYAQECKEEITQLNPKWADKVTPFVPEGNLTIAIDLLKFASDLDISLLFCPTDYSTIPTIVKGACILGVPSELVRFDEFYWYLNKCTWLLRKAGYTDTEIANMKGYSKAVAKYAREIYDMPVEDMNPIAIRTVYEMIPEYEFNFTGKDYTQCAEEFLAIGL